ncbi:MAG: hypothetical protein J0I12_35300 [Candidatus Eremiobacteraeota bacterium]|nr:hypothetical protein [Candidatus Eremiobacteraeota bacterium]
MLSLNGCTVVSRGLATFLWVSLCTVCGLWVLAGLPRHPWRCNYGRVGPHHTFAYKRNSAAYLEYGRRMRTGFAFQVKAMVQQNADLINKFKKGEYRDHREAFESDTTAFCNSVLESVTQWEGQQVPDVLEKSHARIANCHRNCYESVQALREAFGAEGGEQMRLLLEAEKQLKEAWACGSSGVKLHNDIWARTVL